MNPLYQMLSGNVPQAPQSPMMPMMGPMNNPMQRMGAIMQAMRNPAAFIKQRFPDIPDNIINNPDQILSYLQQTRGITDQQIQQLYGMYGGH